MTFKKEERIQGTCCYNGEVTKPNVFIKILSMFIQLLSGVPPIPLTPDNERRNRAHQLQVDRMRAIAITHAQRNTFR